MLLHASLLTVTLATVAFATKPFEQYLEHLKYTKTQVGLCEVNLVHNQAQDALAAQRASTKTRNIYNLSGYQTMLIDTCFPTFEEMTDNAIRKFDNEDVAIAYKWMSLFRYLRSEIKRDLTREEEMTAIIKNLASLEDRKLVVDKMSAYMYIYDQIAEACYAINDADDKYQVRNLITILRLIFKADSVFKDHKYVLAAKTLEKESTPFKFYKFTDTCSLFRDWHIWVAHQQEIDISSFDLEVFREDYYDDEGIDYNEFYTKLVNAVLPETRETIVTKHKEIED